MSKNTKKNWGGSRNGSGRKFQSLKLSHAESMLITDALNGIIIDRDNAEAQLPIEIEDALSHNNLAEKWSVDGDALLEKLRKLSHDAALEIVDSVNKFWNGAK